MAFPNDNLAEKARSALLAGGFSHAEVTRYAADEVTAECEKSSKQESNPVQIGQDLAKIAEYLALAKDGCGFLVVHAPESDRTGLAIAIVQPYHLKFAEKYNRLTLEELA
ncbi:MAG TPA: hypothetical protein VH161_09360 [Candidatus Acidoferrales bacterium]|nr:hypothetical protein [Candidatus Acidoferrales bacterium]